nr:NIb [Hippeastrum mosaic virus]
DKRQGWICSKAEGNLLPVAACEGSLVTKHVIKGPCMLFSTYLATNPDKEAFFRPLMGHYGKSRLNKAAFVQDFFKYADPIELGNVEMEILSQAKQSVIRLLLSAGVGSCNYVTDTDSIFESLNMKAAVGALYKGKKREYFEQFSNEDRDKIIQDSCFRLFSGKMGVWNGSLKAELRPTEKISLNKTRTFTAAPLDSLLGGKVCVDDFNNQFYEGHMKGPWTVGMTKFYKQWDVLFRMLPDGWVYCDADGSRFDSSLTPVLLNCVLNIRSEFLEDWDIGEQMLRNFYTEIVYTPIAVPDGSIIKKCKGNNSGQPSTVVDNTLMVMLAMQYSLAKLGVEFEGQEDVIKYFANGDDLLIAVRPDFCNHILDHLGSLFNQLGLIYDFSHRTREKSELFYLSHCGVLKDGIYIPKLEKERIVSILEWDKSSEPIQRLEAICAAIIEAWGYDDLIHEIRTFYSWVLEQAPYNELAREGKAPYLAELALRHLYTDEKIDASELLDYVRRFQNLFDDELPQDNCIFQS